MSLAIAQKVLQLNPHTYTNKGGQTIHCDFSGVPFTGLRHRLHRIEATTDNNITFDLLAHKQHGNGWRVLLVEHFHDEGKTRACYIGDVHKTLNYMLDNAADIVEYSGYI